MDLDWITLPQGWFRESSSPVLFNRLRDARMSAIYYERRCKRTHSWYWRFEIIVIIGLVSALLSWLVLPEGVWRSVLISSFSFFGASFALLVLILRFAFRDQMRIHQMLAQDYMLVFRSIKMVVDSLRVGERPVKGAAEIIGKAMYCLRELAWLDDVSPDTALLVEAYDAVLKELPSHPYTERKFKALIDGHLISELQICEPRNVASRRIET